LRVPGADPATYRLPPDQLFTDANVGPALELEEWTRPTDSYSARYDVYAGYGMADVPVSSRLRFVFGERIEAARQTVSSFDPFSAGAQSIETSLVRTDLLPSGNVIVKLTKDMNLRFAATRTVARPQLRELAPFVFSDFFGARELLGNPNLDRTGILNLDARWEVFPRAGEVLAVSVFHKRFANPIEPIILPTSRGVTSFQNAKGAVNTGLEVEARQALDFLSMHLREVMLLANFTIVHSRVEIDPASGGIQTSRERPLAYQSPYVLNVALDWNHEKTKTRARILYNVFGPRIAQVGQAGLPDLYEQPRHLVDISVAQGVGDHVDLKATVENVLNSPARLTHGEDDTFLVGRALYGTTAWLLATVTY
jgi:TonB-dependent receptor